MENDKNNILILEILRRDTSLQTWNFNICQYFQHCKRNVLILNVNLTVHRANITRNDIVNSFFQ